jgi:4-amino-4-deoxy-L-arabinose transferase-like glycosyltransferase
MNPADAAEDVVTRPWLNLPADVRRYTIVIALLIALRFVVAGIVPLSADEAYYWMWSRHLGAGYLDHPPAIAWLIRLGTLLFGDTSFGVRFVTVLGSALASLFVWRAALDLTEDARLAARATIYFNLTLMVGVEMLAATPDAPALLTSAALLWSLVRLKVTADGRWWIAIGAIGGLALLSKFTAFFLGGGMLVWLIADPRERRWFLSPWLYAAIALALAVDLPNLTWNANHDFVTYRFQFARVTHGGVTLRYLGEFLLAQVGLCSPFIFALGAVGIAESARSVNLRLIVSLLAPGIVYFLLHSFHDRVQANWPSFLFPMFAIAAALAARNPSSAFVGVARRGALFVAAAMLTLVYLQALLGIFPLGRADPLSRLLAFGFDGVTTRVDAAMAASHAKAILATDYETAAWFSFYDHAHATIVDVSEPARWTYAASADRALLDGPFIYVAEAKSDRSEALRTLFRDVDPLGEVDRTRGLRVIARYHLYRVGTETGVRAGWLLP